MRILGNKMPKYYRIQDVSKEVGRYIGAKDLRLSPNGWRDIYAQEHATAFTVARLKDLSLLESVQKEIAHSIENGFSFEDFQRRMRPKLQSWLDSVRKPIDGPEGPAKEAEKQGKDRYRLRRIFETNTRQAYAQHHYQRGMDNPLNTHIIYRLGPSINHRVDHEVLDGTVLSKDHSFWDSHFPPNGWNCKCHVRFMSQRDVEEARQKGVVDLQSTDPKTGRYTSRKPINETAPKIQWRNFERSNGQVIQVPHDIDPGFEWNPGKVNRNTWLKDQAIRKARALELAPKELEKLEQLILSNQAQQVAYAAFVERYYHKTGPGATIGIGVVQEKLKEDRLQRLGNLPDSDLIILQEKVLNTKDQKHKDFAFGDGSVTKQEFLQVPQMLQRPDILVWDHKLGQYVVVIHTQQRQLLFLPIGVNHIKAMKGHYWTLRSVYRMESYNEVFNEKWRGQYRYEVLKLKAKK